MRQIQPQHISMKGPRGKLTHVTTIIWLLGVLLRQSVLVIWLAGIEIVQLFR